jgi:hypothetical protein
MNGARRIRALVFALAVATAASCRAVRDRARPEGDAPPLSEVGRLEVAGRVRCTATLIAPSLAVTAGHCVAQDLVGVTPADAVLVLGAGGAQARFHIDGAEALGRPATERGGLNGDVGIVHLARPVPWDVARPRPLARAALSAGDTVTFVGLGSVELGAPPRVSTWRFDPAGEGRVMRPGDSGGPVLLGAPGSLGAVAAVGSGYVSTPCAGSARDAMIFGDVAGAAAAIDQAAAAWRNGR